MSLWRLRSCVRLQKVEEELLRLCIQGRYRANVPRHLYDGALSLRVSWGVSWRQSEAVIKQRSAEGSFGFGLPELSDSLWLYVSLAIEKLRPASEGGGRVAALVHPGALSGKRASASIRRRIVDAGVLE